MAAILSPLSVAAEVVEALNPPDPDLEGMCVVLSIPAQGTRGAVPYVAWVDTRSWDEEQMRTWIEARLTGIVGAVVLDGMPGDWVSSVV